ETGKIAQLAELGREVSPELIGPARYLGVPPRTMIEIGRTLGVRDLGELREAAAGGRLAEAKGVGAHTEQKLKAALAGTSSLQERQRLVLSPAAALLRSGPGAVGGRRARRTPPRA